MSSVQHSYPYKELLRVLCDIHTRTRNLCEFCTPRATIPGVRVQHFLYAPGTSVSSVLPCHNTRSFCEFCNTSIRVPETSVSSVRLLYPYPETTNPTEHSLANFHSPTKKNGHVLGNFTAVNYRGKTTVGGNCRDSVDYRGFR